MLVHMPVIYVANFSYFGEGRDVNNDARPGRPSTSTTDENIEAFWIIVELLLERLLMMLAYRSAHAKQFLWQRRNC